MKRLLLLFIIISKIGFSQDTKYLSENYEFKNGEIAYMFGNNDKLRDQPNTESNVLSLLKIGEKVEIVEKSAIKMKFDGIESPWYKIKTENKVGFVLGSLISLDRLVDGNLIYLICLKKEESILFLKTRVLENELKYKENISALETERFSVKASGNKGLENIKSIFEVDYFAESCGINGGGFYLFYDGNDLIKVIDYTRVADGDLYWFIEKYIFPNDKDGVKGKIRYKCEKGETIEDETEWTENKITTRFLEWNGKEIVPKMKAKNE